MTTEEKIDALHAEALRLLPDAKTVLVSIGTQRLYGWLPSKAHKEGAARESKRTAFSVHASGEMGMRAWNLGFVTRESLDDALDAILEDLKAQTPVDPEVI